MFKKSLSIALISALLMMLYPLAAVNAWEKPTLASPDQVLSSSSAEQRQDVTSSADKPAQHQTVIRVDIDSKAAGDSQYTPTSEFIDSYTYDGTAHRGYTSLQFVDMDIVDKNIKNQERPLALQDPWQDPTVTVPFKIVYEETYGGTTHTTDTAVQAASYTLTVELINSTADDQPYWFEYEQDAPIHSFVINPRQVTIVADDQKMFAGTTRPVFTWHVKDGDIVTGETLADVVENPDAYTATVNANTKKPSTYPIEVLEGEVAQTLKFKRNYTFSNVQNGTLTVRESPYTAGLLPQGHYTFPDAVQGYEALTPLAASFTNSGSADITGVAVAIMGAQAACFELTGTTSIGLMECDDSIEFSVVPVQGLAVGDYVATVYVNGSRSITESFTVSFKVVAGVQVDSPGGHSSVSEGHTSTDTVINSATRGTGSTITHTYASDTTPDGIANTPSATSETATELKERTDSPDSNGAAISTSKNIATNETDANTESPLGATMGFAAAGVAVAACTALVAALLWHRKRQQPQDNPYDKVA